ncbi:30S ribosomal protein S8 [Patescibacteria group bacterium]|nr:30S ribosomal protein S8 [Patescibacteria group bacterium]
MTDPIADMLTRIRNAQAVSKSEVKLPNSKIKHSLAKILMAEGYLASVQIQKSKDTPQDVLLLVLKYDKNGEGVIKEITRVSKPGQRIYTAAKKAPKFMQGLGVGIISSSHGLITDEEARRRKIGGELICKLY